MKKVLFLLLLITMLCGCTNNNINSVKTESIFDIFLKENTSLVNTYSSGYKYYLPNGVRIISSNDYNEKLYSNGYYYYLYVDAVSYYYKTNVEYTENSSLFYSKKLDGSNKGYAEIEKIDEIYKIIVYYNYSKIETYVKYEDINLTLVNICNILNSIKFNDSVIEQKIGLTDTNLKVEKFDFYTPRKEGNFIDYINKYDEYEEVNENSIGNEGNE